MERKTVAGILLSVAILISASLTAEGQQPPANNPQPNAPQSTPAQRPATLDDQIAAGDEELPTPVRKLVNWNEYEGKFFTIRLGAGFLYDSAAYAQDNASKEQFELFPEWRVRDARLILKGRIKTDREVTWSAGIMYDPVTEKVLIRETGVMIGLPEILGHVFIGRTKEGFSLNKVMVGYAGWTMERSTINDAAIPILGDGIKWLGYAPKQRLLWNLGAYGDAFSEGQSFSTYDNQVVGRFAWLPMMSEATGKLLHLGLNLRYGKPNEGMLRLRSRPEAFPAPNFVDTEEFPAESTKMAALEAYYRPGPLLLGTEYFVQDVNSPEEGDPFFHGGEVVVSWLATGETRVYNTRGGFFNAISPARTLFEGGPGAWELVARFSYIDLDSRRIQGGKFVRFTPMVNWHVSDNIRLEFAYGYGSLDRFNLVGKTQFFQTRLQLVF